LEQRAREALMTREFQAAADWLDLGALRGDEQMAQVRRVLTMAQAEPRPSPEALHTALPENWRGDLEPLLRSLGP
jgi:hypothetical protein